MLQTNIAVCVLSHAANLLYTSYHLHIHSYIHKGNQGNRKGPVSYLGLGDSLIVPPFLHLSLEI